MALRVLPRKAWRNRRRSAGLRVPLHLTAVEDASRRFPRYGALPLPGLADWRMHKRTRIEHTSGTKESAVHALMTTEAGAPVLRGLPARANPLMLSARGGAALAHGATAVATGSAQPTASTASTGPTVPRGAAFSAEGSR
ncbi:hypothetical protein [Streptomyces shenzhenensis]|uniref:hypothetical protein n=1 Tax=Streptomyces shenzhenensis TaxID=943815 RepID=UPI0027E5BE11|nr:hypothetical protein [Streptomyces shenzhenensis]